MRLPDQCTRTPRIKIVKPAQKKIRVSLYCTLFERVQIITPSIIKFIDDVPEDDDTDAEQYHASHHQYQLSDRNCVCGAQLLNYQQKYCSITCCNKNRAKEYIKRNVIYRVCPVCNQNKLFKKEKQTTCSRSCAAVYRHSQGKANE